MNDHGIGANDDVVRYGYIAKNLGAGSNINVAANDRHAGPVGATSCEHIGSDDYMIPYDGLLANHTAQPAIQELAVRTNHGLIRDNGTVYYINQPFNQLWQKRNMMQI